MENKTCLKPPTTYIYIYIYTIIYIHTVYPKHNARQTLKYNTLVCVAVNNECPGFKAAISIADDTSETWPSQNSDPL